MRAGTCMQVYYYYYAYIHRLTLSNATARGPYCTVTRQVEDIAIEVAALAVGVEGHTETSVSACCAGINTGRLLRLTWISSSMWTWMCLQYSPLQKKTLNNLHFSQHSFNKTESSMRIPFLCHISILVYI